MSFVPNRSTHCVSFFAMFGAIVGLTNDAVPIPTALAPARINSAASSQRMTPPVPMIGVQELIATSRQWAMNTAITV